MEDHDALRKTEEAGQATQAEEGEVMSEATRNPTGHGETATVLTLCLSLGMYLGSLVDDPNLTNFIIGATTLGGKFLQTFLSNWLGAPLASMVGAGAMKGAKLGVVLLAMWLPLGCSWAITSEGAFANFGQSSMSTCGTGQVEGENCTTLSGAPISEQASNVVGGVLAGALRMLGLSYGVPTVPAPAE